MRWMLATLMTVPTLAWGQSGDSIATDGDRALDRDPSASCRAAHATTTIDLACPRHSRAILDRIGLATPVRFATGKSTLARESMPILDEIAARLAHDRTLQLEVRGHHRDRPEAAIPQSHARAKAVVRYLIDRGIEADRLVAVGLDDTAPPPAAARDRRAGWIEFRIRR